MEGVLHPTDLLKTALIATCLLLMIQAVRMCYLVCDFLTYQMFSKPHIRKIEEKFNKLRVAGDPDTNRSDKGFQVIVCGFPRTGTTSMILALHVLGAHTFNPRNVFLLDSAFKYETKVHWEKLLDGFNGISDWPGACAYKKLMDLFPHAKIILTTRDPKKWYKSYLAAIGGAKSPYKHIFKLIYPGSLRCMDRNFQKVMSSNDMDEDACIKCYENHNADVIENVSSQRLLVYNFENDEGWRPLCEFLEVPCPAIPFPSANNQASFNTFVRKAFIVRATIVVFYLLFILLCTIFILF